MSQGKLWTVTDKENHDLVLGILINAIEEGKEELCPSDYLIIEDKASDSRLRFKIDMLLISTLLFKAKHNPFFREKLLYFLEAGANKTDFTFQAFFANVDPKSFAFSKSFKEMLEQAASVDDYRSNKYINISLLDSFTQAYINLDIPAVTESVSTGFHAFEQAVGILLDDLVEQMDKLKEEKETLRRQQQYTRGCFRRTPTRSYTSTTTTKAKPKPNIFGQGALSKVASKLRFR